MSEFVCGVCGNTQPEEGDLFYLVNSVFNEDTQRYEEVGKTCQNCIPPDLMVILKNQGKEGKRRERPLMKSRFPKVAGNDTVAWTDDDRYDADPRS